MSIKDLSGLFGWKSTNENIVLEDKTVQEEESKLEGELEMKNNGDKASYALGFSSGQSIKTQFGGMNAELVIKGFLDSLQNRPLALPEEELKKILLSLAGNLQVHQKNELNQMVSKNQQEEEKFFQNNKGIKGIRAFPSGLQYRILTQGSGTDSPGPNDSVTVHYRGSLLDGTTFVNTYDMKKPITFAMKSCIPGWSESLKRMKVGDKWKLFIPSALAFGEKGNQRFNIQPGAPIIVEMELLSVNK